MYFHNFLAFTALKTHTFITTYLVLILTPEFGLGTTPGARLTRFSCGLQIKDATFNQSEDFTRTTEG